MKILSVVILLLNVLHPDWMANKFFSSSVDQHGSTSVTLSQEFSYEVITTSDSTIFSVTGFQILNFTGKWTSGKAKIFYVKINNEAEVGKGLMGNEYPKRDCAFYLMDAGGHRDSDSYYKLNENKRWKVWRHFKYRIIDQGKRPDLNDCNYKDASEEYYKYYRSYLANRSEKFNWGCNFYLNDVAGNLFTDLISKPGEKFENHILSREILCNRGSGNLNDYCIYITDNKGRQINLGSETQLVNKTRQLKLNYSLCLEEYKKSNEISELIFTNARKLLYPATSVDKISKAHFKDNHLRPTNGIDKQDDDRVTCIIRFYESIKAPQVISNYNMIRHEAPLLKNTNRNTGLVQLLILNTSYNIPKENHSTQSWCYSKNRDRNNSKCMHAYLTECFYKNKKPNHLMMQG